MRSSLLLLLFHLIDEAETVYAERVGERESVRDPSRKAAGHVKSMLGSDQLPPLSLTTRR